MPPGAVPDSASVSRRMLADRRCGHVRVLADHARPPAGARCGKAARRDLCGGQGAIPVPTATASGLEFLRRGLEILPHFLEILPAHGPALICGGFACMPPSPI